MYRVKKKNVKEEEKKKGIIVRNRQISFYTFIENPFAMRMTSNGLYSRLNSISYRIRFT